MYLLGFSIPPEVYRRFWSRKRILEFRGFYLRLLKQMHSVNPAIVQWPWDIPFMLKRCASAQKPFIWYQVHTTGRIWQGQQEQQRQIDAHRHHDHNQQQQPPPRPPSPPAATSFSCCCCWSTGGGGKDGWQSLVRGTCLFFFHWRSSKQQQQRIQ